MIILHDRLMPKLTPFMEGIEAAENLSANVLARSFDREHAVELVHADVEW